MHDDKELSATLIPVPPAASEGEPFGSINSPTVITFEKEPSTPHVRCGQTYQ